MEAVRITGATRIVALLGDPVAHSISPLIHNRAFSRLCLECAYVALRVPRDRVHVAMHALRSLGWVGCNVTVPHKAAVVPYCDRLVEPARSMGVVNTLYYEGSTLCGTSTDPRGFLRALRWMGHDPRGGRAVILGNGGTARTLAFTLVRQAGVSQLTLVGRNAARVGALASLVGEVCGFDVRWKLFSDPELARVCAESTLLVNATSVGMHPRVDESPLGEEMFSEGTIVFDAVYNPPTTRFLTLARGKGCRVQNGLRMLLYQALESFRLWTGLDAPEELFEIEELQRWTGG